MEEKYQTLSKKQKEVFNLALQGFTNKEIANKLFNSPATISIHLEAIYQTYHIEGFEKRAKLILARLEELGVSISELIGYTKKGDKNVT